MVRKRSAAQFWFLDWPLFIMQSAGAWYFTVIGVVGVLLIIGTVAILTLDLFGVRWGW